MRPVGAVIAETHGESIKVNIRTRKFIGAILLMIFIAIYALLVMAVAIVVQVNSSKWVEVVFYVVGGLAWVVPAALLVRWMSRPDEAGEADGAPERAGRRA
jgi:hypothetical protein